MTDQEYKDLAKQEIEKWIPHAKNLILKRATKDDLKLVTIDREFELRNAKLIASQAIQGIIDALVEVEATVYSVKVKEAITHYTTLKQAVLNYKV